MSVDTEPRTDSEADGLVQLRFADEAGQIQDLNAAEFAEVLEGLVEFTGQMARAGLFGDGPPPTVRVRPPQEGSFIVEALITWAVENPTLADLAVGLGIPTGTGLTSAIHIAIKRLRAHASGATYLDNGNVMVTWSDGTVNEVPQGVWTQVNKQSRILKRSVRKMLAPLSDEADVLEVRSGAPNEDTREILEQPPVVAADRTDYRTAAADVDEETEETRTFDAEAQLTSIDFEDNGKWRVQTGGRTRQATIEDEEFLGRLDRGMALHKNDLFDVTIRELTVVRNGRTSREWTLTRVTRKRRGDDDGDAAVAPDSAGA